MPFTLVFDIRSNHDTGVSRYGLSLLKAVVPSAILEGWRLIVVVWDFQEERALAAVNGLDAEILVCPDFQGFVRSSPWLRDLLISRCADFYYTSHYTADPFCPVPFAFTIHDLNRLRFPDLSYTEESFIRRFGHREFTRMKCELARLAEWDHMTEEENLFTRYFEALYACLLQGAGIVMVVSNATADDVQTHLGVQSDRLAFVPGGVDTTFFHPASEAKVAAVRMEYGLNRPYVLFVGLAHPTKRFHWLVDEMFRDGKEPSPGVQLAAVGGHAERLPRVGNLLAKLREDEVIFTGHVPDTNLVALYTGARALVTATANEGIGLPCLEAMACGTPVIAPDIPALRETLGRTGLFYKPGDGDDFRFKLSGVLSAPTYKPSPLLLPDWQISAVHFMNTMRRAMTPHLQVPKIHPSESPGSTTTWDTGSATTPSSNSARTGWPAPSAASTPLRTPPRPCSY